MVKPARQSKAAALQNTLLSTLPWACTSFGEESEIEVYNDAEGKWHTIADVHPFMGFDGEDIASFILRAINQQEATQPLFLKVKTVLETVQKNSSLSPKIKKEIDETVKAIVEHTNTQVESGAS